MRNVTLAAAAAFLLIFQSTSSIEASTGLLFNERLAILALVTATFMVTLLIGTFKEGLKSIYLGQK